MIKRSLNPFVALFLLFFSLELPASAQFLDNMDDLERDFRNTTFPRDKNKDLINESELLNSLPKSTSLAQIYVSDFDIRGNRVFLKEELQELIKEHRGKNLTITDLNSVADLITKHYKDNGYIISFAFIPHQIVTDDKVIIEVFEGEIGEVVVEGGSERNQNFIKARLEPLKSGIILDTKTLERSLMLIQSSMSLEVKATLRPGKKAGTSDIIIQVADKNPYRIGFGFDNYGSEDTALFRFFTNIYVGNIITGGDRLAINLSLGLDHFDFQNLFYGRIDYRFPVGSDGLQLGLAYSRSDYHVYGKFKELNIRGYANDYSFYLEHPLILYTNFSMNIMGRIARKDMVSTILGYENSDDGLYTVSAGLFGDMFLWRGAALYYWASVDQGINWLFNGTDKSLGSSNPDAGGLFTKFYFDAAYFQNILPFFRINTFLGGQVPTQSMFAANRFYIGGIYSVRGFKPGENSGDYGVRGSVEFEFNLGIPQLKGAAFIDAGYVQNMIKGYQGYNSAYMISSGLSFKATPLKWLSLRLDYGIPVAASNAKMTGGIVYGRIGFEF